MASTTAAAPVLINQQEQQSSSSSTSSTSITIPANHHPTNEQQQNRNNKTQKTCIILFFTIFFLTLFFFGILFFDGVTIYRYMKVYDLKNYAYYYMVESFILLVLGCLLLYVACVRRKLYIIFIVSIIFGILFMLDWIMLSIIEYNECKTCGKKCFVEPPPKPQNCFDLNESNLYGFCLMFGAYYLTLFTFIFSPVSSTTNDEQQLSAV